MSMPFQKAGRILAVLLLPLTVSVSAQTNAPEAAAPIKAQVPDDIVSLRHVVIGKGGTQDIHVDITYPKNATKPTPALICIHGGGWASYGGYGGPPIADLARKGYFAAAIDYRLSGIAPWPAQIQDCKLAVRWLRANAAKYNVDPNKIGAWGASAGGHLAACVGTMGDVKEYEGDGGYPGVSSAVQAVVDFYGPTDFVTPGIYTPSALAVTTKLMGMPEAENPAAWKSASPVFYVKAGDPPMLIVQGANDGTVPLRQSTEFDEALTKAGVPHQLVIVKNGGHGLRLVPGITMDPSLDEINATVYAFLDKYLKAPSGPSAK